MKSQINLALINIIKDLIEMLWAKDSITAENDFIIWAGGNAQQNQIPQNGLQEASGIFKF